MYFKSLMVLHLGFLMGQVIFGAIIFYLHRSGADRIGRNGSVPRAYYGAQQELYFYIALGLVFAAIITSYYLYQVKVSRAKERPNLFGILTEYRSAVTWRIGCLQGPSMLAIIGFYVTGNQRYLALTGLIILVLVVWLPTQNKVLADLDLEGEYRSKLEEPDAILW
jgi:hypothetical protein